MHTNSSLIAILLTAQLALGQPSEPQPLSAPIEPGQFTPERTSGEAAPSAGLSTPDVTPRTAAPPTPLEWTSPAEKTMPLPTERSTTEEHNTAINNATPADSPSRASTPPSSSGSSQGSSRLFAKQLMTSALTVPAEGALSGTPLSLLAALERVFGRTQRLDTIKAYWRLSLGTADVYNAARETRFLSTLPNPPTTLEQSQLRAALAEARARGQEALLAVVAAQHDLADVVLRASSDGLPMASDVPLVGRYRTRFETLFANRAAPAGLQRIDATLSYYLGLVEARAESVHAANEALNAAVDAYRSGQVTLPTVLDAHLRLRDQRIAFLAAVRDYNHIIADYALNVAASGVSREEVVSMLIETAQTPSAAVTPNSATEPASGQVHAHDRPATRPNEPANWQSETPNLVPVKPAPMVAPATLETAPTSTPPPAILNRPFP